MIVTFTYILLVLNCFVPLYFIKFYCIRNKKIEINHVLTFSFGYFYYWILPIIAYYLEFDKFDRADPYFQKIMTMFSSSENQIPKYLLFCSLIYASFILGNITKISFHFSRKSKLYVKGKKFLYLMILFLLFYCIVLNVKTIGTGYLNKGSRTYAGMFAAIVCMLCVGTMLTIVTSSKTCKFSEGLKNRWFLAFVIASILLITAGGRLYFISCYLSLLCLYTVFYSKIYTKKFIITFLCVIFFMGIIGVLRIGGSLNMGIMAGVLYNVLAEPVFTGYSLGRFLQIGAFNLLSFPFPLISNLINLVPTVLFPNKSEFFISYRDIGYNIGAPLGALNSFASFNIEFGLIGTMTLVFLLAIFLRKLRSSSKSVDYVIYSLISANLMFTFYRDPVSTSIIKNLLENSIIIPILMGIFYSTHKNTL